ncbi:MAG: esterase, partial [Rhizobiales bacterium 39-66-18]
LILVAGSGELPLMRKQTADFAAHRAAQGLPLHYEEIPGANHFTILETMAEPSGRIAQLITALVKGVAL